MSRKKRDLSFGYIQREIARRLQTGLPLAGMIAATALLTGCNEQSGRVPAGSVPRDPSLCEQQTEKPKPEEPTPLPNWKNETDPGRTRGVPEPPPNRKNETVDPASTRGRFPAMKTDK